jgi:hypothetical protein
MGTLTLRSSEGLISLVLPRCRVLVSLSLRTLLLEGIRGSSSADL